MPIYPYRCDSCGVRFDQRQHFDEDPLTTCPECGERALRKLYLPVGIVFRGSGFYSTDNRSSSGNHSSRKSVKEDAGENGKEKKTEDSKKSDTSSD